MKPTDLVALLTWTTVNNGYALTAFLAVLAVWVYFRRCDRR